VGHYRVYCLDGANKVASAEWIEAADDRAAIERVRKQWDSHKCEVWDKERLVGTVDMRREA
jgi:Leu/Phe-tRNA-protein transferase